MRGVWFAALSFVFIAFTRPDGTAVWINPELVFAVESAQGSGLNPNSQTLILSDSAMIGVREPIGEVLHKLRHVKQ